MDNVIVEQEPRLRRARQLRRGAHRPASSATAIKNTARLHRRERRRPPRPRPGLRDAAQQPAARAARPRRVFRVIYILPWLFTVGRHRRALAAAARPERRRQLPADHAGSSSGVDWLADPRTALGRRDLHQHLGRLPVLHDQPARRAAGHPARPLRGGHGRRRQRRPAVLQRHAPAAATDHHQHGRARPHLDHRSSSRSSG